MIAAACLIPALISSFSTYINWRLSGNGSAHWGDVLFAGGDWIFFGELSPITVALAHRYPLRRDKISRTVFAHLTGAVVLCLAWASIGFLLAMLLNRYPAEGNSWDSDSLLQLLEARLAAKTVKGRIHSQQYYPPRSLIRSFLQQLNRSGLIVQ